MATCESAIVITSPILRSGFRFHPMTSLVPLGALRAGVSSAVVTPALEGGSSPLRGEQRQGGRSRETELLHLPPF